MIRVTSIILLTATISTYHFQFDAAMIPHPEKAHRGGQDAYFSSEQVLAVADGVGGWAQLGIDPSGFSRTLCHNIRMQYPNERNIYSRSPQELLTYAQNNNDNPGSATLVIVTIDPQKPLIYTSYIGDSGYAIFRVADGQVKLVRMSEQQQHGFNFPFQLGRPGMKEADDPALAVNHKIPVQKDDIIVVGSDGLFDNVFPSQIKSQIEAYLDFETRTIKDKKALALKLAEKAIKYGQDTTYESPFSQSAKEHNLSYIGGKLDDTTVIIAQIVEGVSTSDQTKQSYDGPSQL